MSDEQRLPALDELDAVVFDLDGIVTDTAAVHANAWKRLFDEYLAERAARTGEDFEEFTPEDYRRYLDGKPRYDGVASFLESRGIHLDHGDPDDSNKETVTGLGNRKNDYFRTTLEEDGVDAFPSTVTLVRELQARGVKTAIISSSRNCVEVLEAAGLSDLFATKVDGVDSAELGLPGKPDPAVFLEAVGRLGVAPERAAVVEDALSGVEAGKRGGFGMVVGVDRTDDAEALAQYGADVVVGDLAELSLRHTGQLPNALESFDKLAEQFSGRRPVVFLDHDGTLSPIVTDPDAAVIHEPMRAALEQVAAAHPTAIVSGRDLADLRQRVGLDQLIYAGSHGFETAGPPGLAVDSERGEEFLDALDAAERDLNAAMADIPGVVVERKRFAIAVHYRQMDEAAYLGRLVAAVERIVVEHPNLRSTGGKKILEVRPNLNWDKGQAVLWLLTALGFDEHDVVPVYVGDDVTDEDAFRAIRGHGVGVVVDPGERATAAHYTLADLDGVRRFLEALAEVKSERTEGP